MDKRFLVGNLPVETSEAELRRLFRSFGQVSDIQMLVERGRESARRFALVTLSQTAGEDDVAARLNGREFLGRSIVVIEKRARPRHVLAA